MAFVQSLNNQSSVLRINIMVVDDDPIFLGIMSRMLEKSKYRDPSIMEITVIAVRDGREALSTLKIQRNNIDLIVTDYYMPGMNGLQLKQQITRQFGNFPVILMSSDTNKEQESLACGALCFLPKPIKQTDVPQIYQLALTYKRNGKSILHKDTNVSIPKQIQLLPEQASNPQQIQLLPDEQANVSKNKKFSSRLDSRSVNSSKGSCTSTNGSQKSQKRKSNGDSGDDVESMPQPSKKSKILWNDDLHDLFLQAIRHIGLDKAVPKKILEFMDVSYLTRENVASHLQKYRQFLRKVAERGSLYSSMLHPRGIEPYHSNYSTSSSWYNTSLDNRSFYSEPRHGLGQSRLLSTTSEPIRFNQRPYNYMNRSSTYEPNRIGSNVTMPITSNLSFSTQPLQNEGRRSFSEPTVMANRTDQTSQVLGFGQHGLSVINGNNFNNNMMSSYATSNPSQLGMSSYASSTSNQPGMNNHGSLSPNQIGTSRQGSLTPSQRGMSSYGSLTSNQPGMSSHGSLTPPQPGMRSQGSLTPTHPEMSSYGSLTFNQPALSFHASLTPNQLGISSQGSLTPTQPGMSSFGSLTTNQPGIISYESSTPNQQEPSNFSYGLFLNNESTAYKPQPHASTPIQPNLEIPQLENLSLYDDLSNINELPCDISNFELDHDKKQEEEAVPTTNFEIPTNFETELNQIFSLDQEDGDWTFIMSMNQGHSNGEISNTSGALETNDPSFNTNPNHAKEQDVPDFVDWSLLDPNDLANEYDFMDSLFTNDMN